MALTGGWAVTCDRLGARKDNVQTRSQVPMQPAEVELSTDGLPKAFLHSLRTLFDILDDGHRGFVHISEIESRWHGADTRDLPGGVLECLRRVTPPHGCLTFQRFVAGLRHSMLNQENEHSKPAGRPHGPTVRPLAPSNATNRSENRVPVRYCPRKPAPAPLYVAAGRSRFSTAAYPSSKTNIVTSIESLALESPQLHRTRAKAGIGFARSQSETTTGLVGLREEGRSQEEQRRHTITNGVDYGMVGSGGLGAGASPSRPSPAITAVWAAYTTVFIPLSSSLYSGEAVKFFLWLKQMKELEQERDSLLAGLDVVERARHWYQNQIHCVTEKQKHLGQANHSVDFLPDPSQSRLNVLLPKLQEVNHCLTELVSSGVSFTIHNALSSNISMNSQPLPQVPPKAVQRLKDQNRLLTQEVTEKSERITQLEQEKSAIIKQLFEARSSSTHEVSALDSTFI